MAPFFVSQVYLRFFAVAFLAGAFLTAGFLEGVFRGDVFFAAAAGLPIMCSSTE
jgi:hypothetical protein